MAAAAAAGERVVRLNLWSLPRCCSTSLMYSFSRRSDTRVWDEPLYPAYLAAHPDISRPYREQLLRTAELDPNAIVRDVVLGSDSEPSEVPQRRVRFYKHIAAQLTDDVDRGFLRESEHFMLVRHPYRVIASYFRTHGEVSVYDTGLPRLLALHHELRRVGYGAPHIVQNRTLLSEPEATLRKVCTRFGLPFEHAMLSWPRGGIVEDGSWASHWYAGTHESTGFTPPAAAADLVDDEAVLDGLPPHVRKEAALCMPLYEQVLDLIPSPT